MMSIPRHARRGYTLVEMVMSMAVMVVLMTGLASATLLASRALPSDQNPVSAMLEGHDAVEQIANELFCANSVTEKTPTAITFTVADRNADSVAETIRYAWSGTVGDPLTRRYNDGTAINLVDAVYEFDLRYDLVATTVGIPGPTTETPNVLFVNIGIIDPAPDVGYVVSDTTWCGMCFSFNPETPGNEFNPPPPNPTSFTIDTMSPRMRTAGNGQGSGFTAIQLRGADGNGLPNTTVYDELLVDENNLDSRSWQGQMWTATNSPSFGITDTACLVFKAASGTDTAQILFQDTTGLPEANMTTFVTSSDAGASWTPFVDQALTPCYIYATFTSSESMETTTYALTAVGLSLLASPDSSSAVTSSVQVLNTPGVSGP